jgi:hypothetical protein
MGEGNDPLQVFPVFEVLQELIVNFHHLLPVLVNDQFFFGSFLLVFFAFKRIKNKIVDLAPFEEVREIGDSQNYAGLTNYDNNSTSSAVITKSLLANRISLMLS